MNTNLYDVATDSFKKMFDASLKIHPCNYDPTTDLKEFPGNDANTVRCHLPLEAKALRFFTFCEEHGKTGKILTPDYHMETFTSPEYGIAAFVTVKADVFIDNELVGSAIAGQICRVGDFAAMDNIIQLASGLAKSRALTNAGFGVVSGTDVDSALLASQNGPYGNPAPAPVAPAEYPNPYVGNLPPNPQNAATFDPAAVGEDPFGNTPVPGASTFSPQPEQANLFQQLGGKDDLLNRAKQTPYPLAGYYQGKALGSLNTSVLEKLVEKTFSDAAIVTAQNAARLILEDRKKVNGKAT